MEKTTSTQSICRKLHNSPFGTWKTISSSAREFSSRCLKKRNEKKSSRLRLMIRSVSSGPSKRTVRDKHSVCVRKSRFPRRLLIVLLHHHFFPFCYIHLSTLHASFFFRFFFFITNKQEQSLGCFFFPHRKSYFDSISFTQFNLLIDRKLNKKRKVNKDQMK